MLYVIAGASLSGKTSARIHITNTRKISGIDSDTLRTMMNDLRPDMSVGHTQDPLTNYENMRPCIQAFIHARSFFREDYILEGDGINLEDIKKNITENKMKAVILGYPRDTPEHRLEILEHNAPIFHWSKILPSKILTMKIQQCIDYSVFLEHEAKRLNLDYIDVSDTKNIDDVIEEVVSHLF